MRRHIVGLIALVFITAGSRWAAAQERPAAGAGGGGANAALTPFVDEATIAVARVDVAAIKPEAVQAWVTDQLKAAGAKPDELERASKEMQEQMVATKQWQADFAAAGGRTVYLVARMGQPPAVFGVTPLQDNADAKKLTELLKYPMGIAPRKPANVPAPGQPEAPLAPDVQGETIGKTLVVGAPETLQQVKQITPVARADIEKALAGAGGGAVQVAVVPNEALRATLAFAAPKLPPELGGGPITPVSQGVQWVALGVDSPPNAAARLTIQTKDADAARKLRDLIDTGVRSLHAQPGFPKDASVERAVAALTPQVAGDQLKLTLDAPKVAELAKGLGPVLERQREQAKQMASMNHLRQLALAAIMYSRDHKSQLPAKYPDDLEPYLQGGFDTLQVNPRLPDRRPGFVYVRAADTLDKVPNAQEAVLFYESRDPKDWGAGICVAFADGHCEFIQDRPTFDRMLKATTKAAEADGAAKP